MRVKGVYIFLGWLVSATLLSGLILSSTSVLAEESHIDNVSLAVPIACTMTGTGMNSHTATIPNGTVNSSIGETTIKAYCNDADGFAIYAIGYTDNTDGKNVLASSTMGSANDIATGTATSGNNSNWAMKLSTVTSPSPTYPVTIENSFGSFHSVPNDYIRVAKRTSATDTGENAEGSTLKTTYQAFISSTQLADTYIGKVKYVMVHPNNTEETPVKSDQIAVVYDGNGLTFQGGASTNKAVYSGNNCSQKYVGTNPTIVKSPNLEMDGTKKENYEAFDFVETVSFSGADAIMVVVDYGMSFYSNGVIAEGEWEGGWEEPSGEYYILLQSEYEEESGTKTFIFDNDTATIYAYRNGVWNIDYDYGVYAKFYPIYETEQSNTIEKLQCNINSTPASGSYAETTTWNGKWYIEKNGNVTWLSDENDLLDYLDENSMSLLGTTVNLRSYHQYVANYNGNNATAGTMTGFNTTFDTTSHVADLIAPNFYKSGHGFIGWSEDPNATANNGAKIFGPNENIKGGELHFDNNTHETTLYAIWAPSNGSLQNWSNCSSLPESSTTALTDQRDGTVYAVAKLADGNCWMIENLRLNADNSSDSTKAQGFGGVFTGLADSEPTTNFTNNLSAPDNSKYSSSNITGDNQRYRFPRYNNSNLQVNDSSLTPSPIIIEYGVTSYKWYSYGNYYSWAAAMANTTNYTSVSASDSANTSICPSGWRLPYGGENGNGNSSGGFYYLSSALVNDSPDNDLQLVSIRSRAYPNNIVYSCNIGEGRNCSIGDYWSSSSQSGTSAYEFTIGDKYAYFPTANKYMGQTVRCVMINH